MILLQREGEQSPLIIANGVLRDEDCIVRDVAPAGTSVHAPGGLILSVDRVIDGPGDALLAGAIFEIRFQGALGRVRKVGGRLH